MDEEKEPLPLGPMQGDVNGSPQSLGNYPPQTLGLYPGQNPGNFKPQPS
jgi:hypothetical protein